MSNEEQKIDWQVISPALKLSVWSGILLNEINSITITNQTIHDSLVHLLFYVSRSLDLMSIDFQMTVSELLLDETLDTAIENTQVSCIILSIASSKLLALTEMNVWKSAEYSPEQTLNTLLVILWNIMRIAKTQNYSIQQLVDSSAELLK